MLYEPARHEPLQSMAWDHELARSTIRAITLEMDETLDEKGTWDSHPDDGEPCAKLVTLFLGACGTAWALLDLEKRGFAGPYRHDYARAIASYVDAYLAKPDIGDPAPGLLLGESGLRFVAHAVNPEPNQRAALLDAMRRAISAPELELMWSAPGVVAAARLLYESTRDESFLGVVSEGVEHLMSTWVSQEGFTGRMWTQNLYGNVVQLLGGVHGFAGNVYALLRSNPYLDVSVREEILDHSAEGLLASASVHDGLANWPTRVAGDKYLVQWCHGAPGIITSFADYPVGRDARVDEILERAGELTWVAGPLTKPFGICHGAAGNGLAFLRLYKRTQKSIWLDRARAFAMHAIAQSESQRKIYGRRRAGLYLGDLGLAQYLYACLEADPRWPTLDRV